METACPSRSLVLPRPTHYNTVVANETLPSVLDELVLQPTYTRATDTEKPTIIDHVISFIKCPQEDCVKFFTSRDAFFHRDTQAILDKATYQDRLLRDFYFDPQTNLLTLVPMARPLHDSIEPSLVEMMNYAISDGLFTRQELRLVKLHHWSKILVRLGITLPKGTKRPAQLKNPDQTITYLNTQTNELLPTVIVEVGFAESYNDLLRDVSQWLQCSLGRGGNGGVQLGVLIKIEEDKKSLHKRQKSKRFTSHVKWLVSHYGNSLGMQAFGLDTHYGNEGSDFESHESLKDAIQTEDWVGTLGCFVEFWTLENGIPAVRGARVNILPAENSENPVIYLSDMVPSVYQDPDFNGQRTFVFDLETYRYYLDIGKKDLAHLRAVETIRPTRHP